MPTSSIIMFSKYLAWAGAILQLSTGLFILVQGPLHVRTFGLDYTLYDLIYVPPVIIGIVLLIAAGISFLVLFEKVTERFKLSAAYQIHTLIITGFIGNCLGGLLVVIAGLLLSLYQQKHDKTWPEKEATSPS